MKIEYYKHDLVQKTASKISRILEENVGQKTLFLVSGGSALRVLDQVKINVVMNKLTVGIIDERWSRNEGDSNFILLTESGFYKTATESAVRFIDIRAIHELSRDVYEAGKNLDNYYYELFKYERIKKVVVLLGMGEDGHTAGIMPYPENRPLFDQLFEGDDLFIGYNAYEKNNIPERITVTNHFLRSYVDCTISFVSGDQKKEKLREVLENGEKVYENPAKIMHHMNDVFVFTDIDL